MPFPTFISPLCFLLKGVGTSEDVIIEILASRTKAQIKEIIKAYKEGKAPGAPICALRAMRDWLHSRDGVTHQPPQRENGIFKSKKVHLTLLSAWQTEHGDAERI